MVVARLPPSTAQSTAQRLCNRRQAGPPGTTPSTAQWLCGPRQGAGCDGPAVDGSEAVRSTAGRIMVAAMAPLSTAQRLCGRRQGASHSRASAFKIKVESRKAFRLPERFAGAPEVLPSSFWSEQLVYIFDVLPESARTLMKEYSGPTFRSLNTHY